MLRQLQRLDNLIEVHMSYIKIKCIFYCDLKFWSLHLLLGLFTMIWLNVSSNSK